MATNNQSKLNTEKPLWNLLEVIEQVTEKEEKEKDNTNLTTNSTISSTTNPNSFTSGFTSSFTTNSADNFWTANEGSSFKDQEEFTGSFVKACFGEQPFHDSTVNFPTGNFSIGNVSTEEDIDYLESIRAKYQFEIEQIHKPDRPLHFALEEVINSDLVIKSKWPILDQFNIKSNLPKYKTNQYTHNIYNKLSFSDQLIIELDWLLIRFLLSKNYFVDYKFVDEFLIDYGFVRSSLHANGLVELKALNQLPALRVEGFAQEFDEVVNEDNNQTQLFTPLQNTNLQELIMSTEFLNYLEDNLSLNSLCYLALTKKQLEIIELICNRHNPLQFNPNFNCINYYYFYNLELMELIFKMF